MRKTSDKIKVLMVGTHKSTKGGMWTVASSYINSADYNENVYLTYIPTYIVGSSVKKIVFTAFSIIRIFFVLLFNRPHLLHVHMSERGSVYRKGIVIRLAKSFGCKVIIHMHGAEFQDWYESLNDKKKNKVKRIIGSADRVIILGKYWESFISSIVPESKIRVVYNSVVQRENIYDPNGSTLLFLGVVGQRKGAYDLVKAFAEIKDKLPENIKLDLYGPDFEHKIETLIKDSGASDRIHYCGWLENDKKETVFKDTICNILPSYNEGLPMTILETMSYGIPNISTSVAAIPEVINSDAGILICPGKIEELKAAIMMICSDVGIRNSMSDNSYGIINDVFSINKHIDHILQIYRELC